MKSFDREKDVIGGGDTEQARARTSPPHRRRALEDRAAKKVSPAVAQTHPAALDEFKNAYSLEFLGLSDGHSEADLHGALLRNLGRFITELGRDFCFVGSEYPVQVGKQTSRSTWCSSTAVSLSRRVRAEDGEVQTRGPGTALVLCRGTRS